MKIMALKLPKIVVYLFVKSSHTLDVITFFIDKMYKLYLLWYKNNFIPATTNFYHVFNL